MSAPKRYVEGHPGPDVPNELQYYACERPEDARLDHVLFHSDCPRCMVALHACVLMTKGVILMTHGRTCKDAAGSFFRG